MGNIIPFNYVRGMNNYVRIYTNKQTQTICETPYTDQFTQTEIKLQETSAQTEVKRQNESVQTELTFTEQLSHNNRKDVGSAKVFANTCEMCDEGLEKEAVGYCRTCCQYMCLQCCKGHKLTTICTNHHVVGKAEFGNLVKQVSLYNKWLAPVHPSSCSFTLSSNWHKIGAFNIPNSEIIMFWIPCKTEYVCSLDSFDTQSGKHSSKKVNVLNETKEDMCEHSEPKCNKMAYFVIVQTIPDKLNKIYNDSNTAVFKYCPEHDKDSIRIAFKFCGLSHSVVPFNGGLALSVYIKTRFSTPDWSIRLTDVKGNIINQICYDDQRNVMFIEPRHLASSIGEDVLFVSDYQQNSVTALDKYAHVIFKYTHELINRPLGITCDEENNVYVACGERVVQIHKDGDKCRYVLRSFQDIVIVDVCYNPVSKQLAVAENSPRATIFKFFP